MIVAEETARCHVAHGEEDGELEADEAEDEHVEEEDADVEEYQVAIGRWARSEGREETSGGKVLAEEGNKKKMRWGKSEENNRFGCLMNLAMFGWKGVTHKFCV
ncbi:hypothetical protein LINPERPRIM_LOCUS5576 [Linum perenne]